jgi:hypothetical protein
LAGWCRSRSYRQPSPRYLSANSRSAGPRRHAGNGIAGFAGVGPVALLVGRGGSLTVPLGAVALLASHFGRARVGPPAGEFVAGTAFIHPLYAAAHREPAGGGGPVDNRWKDRGKFMQNQGLFAPIVSRAEGYPVTIGKEPDR